MGPDLYSEEEVIKGCIKKDRRFQEILYRRYARKMYGICKGYAGNRSLAQDMLQDAFIKVFRNLGQFTGKGSVEGWIRRIVTNTAIDHLRQGSNYSGLFRDETYNNPEYSENETFAGIAAKDILSQVSRLPKGARIVFNLYAVEGFSHKEIAEKLNITTGTSKSQYSRAKQLLQEWLQKIDN